MNPHWKQNNPFDQLTVIRAAIQGHLDNLKMGITSAVKSLPDLADQVEQLEPFLKNPELWIPSMNPTPHTPPPDVNPEAPENPEAKFIAATLIINQLPLGRAIDDQSLMQEAAQLSGDHFFAPDADELYSRLSKTYRIFPVDSSEIQYFVMKP